MAKIVFKQRHTDPKTHRKNNAGSNAQHLKYIATRPGVLIECADRNSAHLEYIGTREGVAEQQHSDNGLFGYINGAFSDNFDMDTATAHISKATFDNRDVFRCVYSFTEETAQEAELNSMQAWQSWAKDRVSEIALRMGIKKSNMEYFAAVHLKEGQPHIHIMYWDKEQTIQRNYVNPKICDEIRIDAIKATFHDQFVELHNEENRLLKEVRHGVALVVGDMRIEIPDKEYCRTTAKALDSFYDRLPEQGRLAYKYLSGTQKRELDGITRYIINNNPQLKAVYDDIIEKRQIYNEMLHSQDTKYGRYKYKSYMGKIEDDILKGVGNTLLSVMAEARKSNQAHLFSVLDAAQPPEITEFPQYNYGVRHRGKYIEWSNRYKQGKDAIAENNIPLAIRCLTSEANDGNQLAVYELADLIRRGKIDTEIADSADKLYADALAGFIELESQNTKMSTYLQYRIGRMCLDGYGIEQNYEKAYMWLALAAAGGNHNAEYALGSLYNRGLYVEQDFIKAEDYFRKASNGGNDYASCSLARLYLSGNIRPQPKVAEELLDKVRRSSNRELSGYANYLLGSAYYYNEELHDRDKAVECLTMSAAGGNEYAAQLLDRIAEQELQRSLNIAHTTLSMLETNSRDGDLMLSAAASAVFGRGDLSKEAIRELIYRKKDKQNESNI